MVILQYTNPESLCRTPETNIMLYANCTSKLIKWLQTGTMQLIKMSGYKTIGSSGV